MCEHETWLSRAGCHIRLEQGLSRDSWDSRRSKLRPCRPHDFKLRVSKELLRMDNPSWGREEPMNCGIATVAQCEGKGTADAPSPSLIWSCSRNKDLRRGIRIHNDIQRRGLVEKNYSDALVTLYAKCGKLQKAQALLDMHNSSSVIPWNALIAGYAREGDGQTALYCFKQMQHQGLPPTAATFTCVLKACAVIGAINMGKQIHNEILRQGLLERNVILGNALVDMYAKCGALCQAQNVLEKLPYRNVVSWSALIGGCVQNGQGQQALDCFKQMQREGILPDEVTYVCILKACAVIGAIDKGTQFHDEISRQGLLEHHVVLGGALVDMYAKCGVLCQAQSVLEKLPSRNVISWSALIAGYAQNGQVQEALDCFEQMKQEGILPNEVTFLCLLNMCAHLGLVEKGQELFDSMDIIYGLKPSVDIFTCMVDLLGRAGHLMKAVEVIQGMPVPTNSSILHCLLGACKQWVDVNVGTWAFEQAVKLDKCDSTAYVSMVNVYAAAGMLEKAKNIEAMRIKNKA